MISLKFYYQDPVTREELVSLPILPLMTEISMHISDLNDVSPPIEALQRYLKWVKERVLEFIVNPGKYQEHEDLILTIVNQYQDKAVLKVGYV